MLHNRLTEFRVLKAKAIAGGDPVAAAGYASAQRQWDDKATVQEIRGLLGRMLFPSQDADKPVKALSGGETARLLMSKLTLTGDNLLILDEPTNHLDLESIRALTDAMQKYEGTLVFVVHDQAVLEEVATCVLELRSDGSWDFFPGRYEDFLRKTGKS